MTLPKTASLTTLPETASLTSPHVVREESLPLIFKENFQFVFKVNY